MQIDNRMNSPFPAHMNNGNIVMEMSETLQSIPMTVNNQRVISEPVTDTVNGFEACATRLSSIEGGDDPLLLLADTIPVHIKQEIVEYVEEEEDEESETNENQVPSPSSSHSSSSSPVVRQSNRRRTLNPIWKSLLTGHTFDETIEESGSSPKKVSRLEENTSYNTILSAKEDLMYQNIVKSEHLVASVARELEVETSSYIDNQQRFIQRPKLEMPESYRNSNRDRGSTSVYACFVCGKTFVSEKYLSMHVSLHGASTNDIDNANMRDVKVEPEYVDLDDSSSQENITIVTTEINHQAESPKKLKKTTKPTGDGGWSCTLCNKSFAHNSGYKNHMRTHSNERPYVCQICDIGFKKKVPTATLR